MLRFSMNTVGLYPNLPYSTAFSSLRAHGYDTFELWSLGQTDPSALREEMDAFGMRLSTFCPSFFILNDGARHEEYLLSLQEALRACKTLACPSLITQVGQDTGAPRAQQHEAIVKGLRRAVPYLEEAGVTLLVEPLNDVKDHKGYYLTDSNEGFDLIRQVGSRNVRLLYDVYHQHHMGEDVLQRISDNLPLIGHLHIAGHPNRDERLFENFDYSALFSQLQALHFERPIGVELFPSSPEACEELLQHLRQWC